MSESSPETLVLVGPMGSGKTTIGRRLARALSVPFTDTDALVVAKYGPIVEIFRNHGEASFREKERQAVRDAVSAGGVIAVGGGAVLDEGTRALLSGLPVVLLTLDKSDVARRTARQGTRPLLAGATSLLAEWTRIYDSRKSLYAEVANVTFNSSEYRPAGLVDLIVSWARRDGADAGKDNS